MGTILKTDLYEFTMLDAALYDGTAHRNCVFEVFTRKLPPGRGWGIVAGVGRLIHALGNFIPTAEDWEYLKRLEKQGIISDAVRKYFYDFKFNGRIWAYKEGGMFFPYSPVVRVEGTFAECILLETLVLSIMNHDSAIASAASRFRCAAGKALLVEMGSRRTDEESAVHAARAAYIGGFDMTSNMEANRRYSIPVAGTHAHAWVLGHKSERASNEFESFAAWFRKAGPKTTILVDTYDFIGGIERAIRAHDAVFGEDAIPEFRVRLDSGDPVQTAAAADALLKSQERTRKIGMVITGDLDEYTIAEIASRGHYVPTPSYGVGTNLVTGLGEPTCGFVYKLVEVDGLPVSKKSEGKGYAGGRKVAYRLFDRETGDPLAERLFVGEMPERFPSSINAVQLQALWWDRGRQNHAESIGYARDRLTSNMVTYELHNRLNCEPLLTPSTEPVEYAITRTV
jgi:nicotinate phosphoribosyltransferase